MLRGDRYVECEPIPLKQIQWNLSQIVGKGMATSILSSIEQICTMGYASYCKAFQVQDALQQRLNWE